NLKRRTSAVLEHLPALKSARTVYELAIGIGCLEIECFELEFQIWFELEFFWLYDFQKLHNGVFIISLCKVFYVMIL
ncbi:unnamed protein product, partial [Brassica oleracea]